MLELINVCKTFNPGTVNAKVALNDLNLTLNDGDFVTVIGGNGAGKSTMLNAIAGSFQIDSGKIVIDGSDVTGLPEHKRAALLGRVFQDPMMGTAPTMQIEENLALAARRGQHRGLKWGITKAERAEYRKCLHALDLGLEDRMTAKVGLLSGGQRQALTLLMAALQQPKLLLLDEHTAALDPRTAAKVLDLSDRIEQCPDCRGSGCAKGTTAEVCPDCRGSGVIQQRRQTPLGYMSTSAPCQRCGGKGKIIHQPCPKCGGKGMIRHRKTIKVSIPAGIDNGQTISLRAQGNAGKNGGPAGDLLIVVSVRPHEIFRREGTSVLCEAPITFTQAVLGAELEIPTIDGKVKYTIPEGTQSGTTFRLKGKGIPGLNGRGRGDQYVTVYIETPRNLNREQKEALKKFSESLGEKNYEEHKSFFGKFKL